MLLVCAARETDLRTEEKRGENGERGKERRKWGGKRGEEIEEW